MVGMECGREFRPIINILQKKSKITYPLPSFTRSSQVNHQSRWDPSLPADYTYLDTDNTVVSTTNSLSHLWTQPEKFQKPTDFNWDSVEKSGMCFGNRTQRTSNPPFSGEIRLSHWSLIKPYRDPILRMFFLCLITIGAWDFSFPWISVFLVGIGENSGIEVRILWPSLNPYGRVEFPCNEITGPNFDRFRGVGV